MSEHACPECVLEQLACRLAQLLNSRVDALPGIESKHAQERKFFLAFDAWVQPDIVAFLDSAKSAELLSDRARRLFLDDNRPKPGFPLCLIDLVSATLSTLLEGNARRLRTRRKSEGLDPLDPNLQRLKRRGWEFDDVISRIAEYLEKVFELYYPGDEMPSKNLESAFIHFASGTLAFLDRKSAGCADTSVASPCNLNAEPDSSLFFTFGEFAWHAARVRTTRRKYWWSMAQLFVALQEVYCRVYGPVIGPRNVDSYHPRYRELNCPIEFESAVKLIEHYREWFRLPKMINYDGSLADKMACNALSAFAENWEKWAEVNEHRSETANQDDCRKVDDD
ncbi:MAG: hypothetical protein ACKVWV_00780 [Planctomycetota bacterium]